MPHTLTETATFDAPAGETVPSDGDAENAASVAAASVGFQALANRTQFLKSAVQGLALGMFDAYSLDGSTIVVTQLNGLVLGTALLSYTSSQTITPSGLTTLSSNAYFFVYAYNNAGAVAFEVNTTVPDSARIFKTGDATRRYVCTFHTYSGSNSIRQFTLSRGLYQYRFSAMTSAEASPTGGPFAVLSTTTAAGSFTNLNLDALVPPSAQFVDLIVSLYAGNGTAAATLDIIPSGDAGTNATFYSLVAAPSAQDQRTVMWRLPVGTFVSGGTHRGIAYKYAPGAGAVTAQINVAGYLE